MYELPEEIRLGLEQARKRDQRQKNRLRVRDGVAEYPVLRLWETGFSMPSNGAEHLRGFVDIYDGARQLYQCLIVCCAVRGDERIYEFKRHTPARQEAPVDFVRDENAPVALLSTLPG